MGPSCGCFDSAREVKAAIEARGRASYLNLPHFKSRAKGSSHSFLPPSLPHIEAKELGESERERERGETKPSLTL